MFPRILIFVTRSIQPCWWASSAGVFRSISWKGNQSGIKSEKSGMRRPYFVAN